MRRSIEYLKYLVLVHFFNAFLIITVTYRGRCDRTTASLLVNNSSLVCCFAFTHCY